MYSTRKWTSSSSYELIDYSNFTFCFCLNFVWKGGGRGSLLEQIEVVNSLDEDLKVVGYLFNEFLKMVVELHVSTESGSEFQRRIVLGQ